jgi:septum formation protein
VLDGNILGKPDTADTARRVLASLSGRTHQVMTGCAVALDRHILSAVDTTIVEFRVLEPNEIDAYVATGEPLDKAGSYAIQGGAAAFVRSVSGATDTVIGLHLDTVHALLAEIKLSARH